MAEPQITLISSYLATHLPTDGLDVAVAREGWRRAIRAARDLGRADWIADLVARAAPDDPVARAHSEAIRR